MRILPFFYKTVLFFAFLFIFAASQQAQAQTDTTYQKPSLNNGMPPANPTLPPVIVKPPAPTVKTEETQKEEKAREKEEKADAKEKLPLKERLFTGGSFGLDLGNYQSFVQVAPILGYKFSEHFAAGVGLDYIYLHLSDPYSTATANYNITGGKVFAQAMIYNGIFAHAEYEVLRIEGLSIPIFPVGVGYRQMFSDKAGVDLMGLWDLNQNEYSFYSNPIIRLGLIINL